MLLSYSMKELAVRILTMLLVTVLSDQVFPPGGFILYGQQTKISKAYLPNDMIKS